jgi:SAM-dependent methyltransferase
VPRPDVVDALREICDEVDPVCGFELELDLPDFDDDSLPITLEFSDGQSEPRSLTYQVKREIERTRSRAAYKDVWNAAADNCDMAKISVAGYTDEEQFESTAQMTRSALEETVGIGPDDVVLEIGAGVGRVGRALAPICKRWIGTDVSENMLRFAQERLVEFDNTALIPISGWDLSPIPDESVDVVYCTVVFMHLDEWERFNYIQEGMRILKPGGRLYVDNFNLLGDQGWEFFLKHLRGFHPLDRPLNISKSSTPDELETYLNRAGFDDIRVKSGEMWVHGTGRKAA